MWVAGKYSNGSSGRGGRLAEESGAVAGVDVKFVMGG